MYLLIVYFAYSPLSLNEKREFCLNYNIDELLSIYLQGWAKCEKLTKGFLLKNHY